MSGFNYSTKLQLSAVSSPSHKLSKFGRLNRRLPEVLEISPVASLDMILSKKANNRDADQSACMCRLVYAFVGRKSRRQVYSH